MDANSATMSQAEKQGPAKRSGSWYKNYFAGSSGRRDRPSVTSADSNADSGDNRDVVSNAESPSGTAQEMMDMNYKTETSEVTVITNGDTEDYVLIDQVEVSYTLDSGKEQSANIASTLDSVNEPSANIASTNEPSAQISNTNEPSANIANTNEQSANIANTNEPSTNIASPLDSGKQQNGKHAWLSHSFPW